MRWLQRFGIAARRGMQRVPRKGLPLDRQGSQDSGSTAKSAAMAAPALSAERAVFPGHGRKPVWAFVVVNGQNKAPEWACSIPGPRPRPMSSAHLTSLRQANPPGNNVRNRLSGLERWMALTNSHVVEHLSVDSRPRRCSQWHGSACCPRHREAGLLAASGNVAVGNVTALAGLGNAAALADPLPLRLILGQPTSTIVLPQAHRDRHKPLSRPLRLRG
jgi:hypothetical protein